MARYNRMQGIFAWHKVAPENPGWPRLRYWKRPKVAEPPDAGVLWIREAFGYSYAMIPVCQMSFKMMIMYHLGNPPGVHINNKRIE